MEGLVLQSLPLFASGVAGVTAVWLLFGDRAPFSALPHLKSRLPLVGRGPEFFSSMATFCKTYQQRFAHGFSTRIFGRIWVFVYDPQDIAHVLKSSEKTLSMYQAIHEQAGFLMPKEAASDYPNETVRKLCSQGDSMEGHPTTPILAAVLKPNRLRAIGPNIRKTVQQCLAELPDQGRMDIFCWCQELVLAITARVLLGHDNIDAVMLKEWMQLLQQAEPDQAVATPGKLLWALLETKVTGERRIYTTVRNKIYPLVTAAMDRCEAGEPEAVGAPLVEAMVRVWYDRLKAHGLEEHLRSVKRRIANDVFLVSFAAVTNSATMAAWALYHTVRNTNGSGEAVRAEMQAGLGQELTTQGESLVPSLENMIYEIGRLYTPGAIVRLAKKATTLPAAKVTVPKGAMVAVSVHTAQRMPSLFQDPLTFDPSRFDRGERTKAGSLALSFGGGTHPCVGRKMAVLEVALFVADALEEFEWSLVQDDEKWNDLSTKQALDVENHPPMDFGQTNSIWRPTVPVWMEYRRKKV